MRPHSALVVAWLCLAIGPSIGHAAGDRAPIAHAGDDQTIEGGVVGTLDGSYSWDADGDALTFAWTQIEGPAVTLDFTDPVRPRFTAPIPGQGSVPAENQVLAFRLTVSDLLHTSAPSGVRLMILKPFDPIADDPAVVTNSLVKDAFGNYPPGSLGFAMQYANAHPGARITFDLPSSDPSYNAAEGIWSLPHGGAGSIPVLRNIAGNPSFSAHGITIDGFSQRANAASAGAFANPIGPAVYLNGVILEVGLWADAAPYPFAILIRGLGVSMYVEKADNLVLSGNYYSVSPDGNASLRPASEHTGFSSGGTTCGRLGIFGGSHIRVGGASPDERNLFGQGCPSMQVGPSYNLRNLLVTGNYFGLDSTGSHSIITDGGEGLLGSGNPYPGYPSIEVRVGGVTPGSRNVFSGFGNHGMYLNLGKVGDRAVITGNYFGTDATGTIAIPNGEGARLDGPTCCPEFIVGGPEPGAGNLMSGNLLSGLHMYGPVYELEAVPSRRVTIQGNRIGTSVDGLSALPNGTGTTHSLAAAVSFESVRAGVLLGGSGPGEGNVIAGNLGNGVVFAGLRPFPGHLILGNTIGVAADGRTPLGNSLTGLRTLINYGSQAVVVGGVADGEGNLIAHNGGNGVILWTADSGAYGAFSTIRGNSIHHNGLLGISLWGGGAAPLPNDPGDADVGENGSLNYPVLSSASTGGGGTTISGDLDTQAGLGVMLDFYASGEGDPSGYGEGQRYLGSHSFVAGAGPTPFSATLPFVLSGSEVVTATTTDESGSTSEFSRWIAVVVSNSAPSASDGSVTTDEDTSVAIDLAGSDPDNDPLTFTLLTSPAHGTLSGAAPTLTYTPAADYSGGDVFTFRVSDGSLDSAAATVSITVVPINDPPTVSVPGDISMVATSTSGAAVTFTATGNDVEDGPLTPACAPASGSTFPLGTTTVTCSVEDAGGATASASFTVTVTPNNRPPVCTAAIAAPLILWPPNHRWVPISIHGVTDPDGDTVTIVVTSLFQDEPTDTRGDGSTSVDGKGVGTSTAWVRAERLGNFGERSGSFRDEHEGGNVVRGDGRVYHISFTATDGNGGSCAGQVTVGVPHDRGRHSTPVDGGALYDSTKPATPPGHHEGDGCEDGDHEKGGPGSDHDGADDDGEHERNTKSAPPRVSRRRRGGRPPRHTP